MGNYLTSADQLEARPGQLASKTASPSEHLPRILVAGVMLILPIIVIVCSKFPLYNSVGYLDPWFYTGYFNNLAELYKWFGPTYYFSRLPWIVPGYIAYHLLPAKWAYFALHACFLYLGGIFTYLLLRSRYDRYAGIVGFALLVANPLYLMSQSWEYVDGAGIVYLLAGMYFFDSSRRWTSGYLALGLAGTFWMFAINCNLVFVIFAGSYFCANIYPTRITNRVLKQLAMLAIGSLLSIAFLGVLNHFLVGGTYWFFEIQLSAAKSLMASGDLAKYKKPLWFLVKSEYRILVPLVLLVVSAAMVRRDAQRRTVNLETPHDQELSRDALFVLLSFTGMLMWEFLAHGLALEMTYYFSYMLPGIVLLSAGLISRWSQYEWGRGSTAWLSPIAIVGAGVIPVFLGNSPGVAVALRTMIAPYILAVLLVFRAWTVTTQSKILCMLLAFYTTSSFMLSPRVYDHFFQQGSVNKGAHLGGIRLIADLHQQIPSGTRFLFWFRSSLNPPAGQEFESISSLYLWATSCVNNRMPELSVEDINKIANVHSGFIVLLARNPEEFAQAVDSFSRHGLEPRVSEHHTITEAGLKFHYLIVRLQKIPDLQSPIEGRVQLNADGWPETLRFPKGPLPSEVYRLSGSGVREMFRSSMDGSEGLGVYRYGQRGALEPGTGCLHPGDHCGRYSSDDMRDHMATSFLPVPAVENRLLFFSVWAKPAVGDTSPSITLQGDLYIHLADAYPLSRRPDGWVFFGGWVPAPGGHKVRVVIQQAAGKASLLENMYLVDVPEPSRDRPSDPPR